MGGVNGDIGLDEVKKGYLCELKTLLRAAWRRLVGGCRSVAFHRCIV